MKRPIRFLNEGKEYIERGDDIQASEKIYKAAEESIKILSRTRTTDVHEEAMRKGRWTKDLLFKAAEGMGREIRHYWDSAWTLHVQGFHERCQEDMGGSAEGVDKEADIVVDL